MPELIDLTGQRFGNLVVLKKDINNQNDSRIRWICRCSCGKEWSVRSSNLRSKITKSCGCLSRRQHLKHGLHSSPEYIAWKSMIQRCTNPQNRNYQHYGGRGINVCKEWMQFKQFYDDMGSRPSDKHTLDRVDNSGNYEPGNCRWATMLDQSRNTRRCVYVCYDGKTVALSEAITLSGLKASTVYGRRRLGWPQEEWFLPYGSKRSLS